MQESNPEDATLQKTFLDALILVDKLANNSLFESM